jgi:hypothetical protein
MMKIILVWLLMVIAVAVFVVILSIPITAVLWLLVGSAGIMALFLATGGISMSKRKETPKVVIEKKD